MRNAFTFKPDLASVVLPLLEQLACNAKVTRITPDRSIEETVTNVKRVLST
jgi:hypothetical protein